MCLSLCCFFPKHTYLFHVPISDFSSKLSITPTLVGSLGAPSVIKYPKCSDPSDQIKTLTINCITQAIAVACDPVGHQAVMHHTAPHGPGDLHFS